MIAFSIGAALNPDDIWKHAMTSPDGTPPDTEALAAEIRKVPQDYEFITLPLPHPEAVMDCGHRELGGKPVRYVRAFDGRRNEFIECWDFMAKATERTN